MAITNAQQYQQLVNKPANGKRPGYRGPGGYQGGRSSRSSGPAGGASSGGNYGGNQNKGGGGGGGGGNQNTGNAREDYISNYVSKSKVKGGGKKITTGPDVITGGGYEDYTVTGDDVRKAKDRYEKQFYDRGQVPPLGSRPTGFKTKLDQRNKQKRLNYINRLIEARQDKIRKGLIDYQDKVGQIQGLTDFDTLQDYIDQVQSVDDLVASGFYSKDGRFADGDIPDFQTTELPGLAGLVLDKFKGPVTSDRLNELMEEIDTLKGLQTTSGLEGTNFNELMETYEPNRFKLMNPEPGGRDDDPILPLPINQDPTDPTDPVDPRSNFYGLSPRIGGSIFDFTGLANGGRAGMMDGGMMDDTPEGGIMDLETGRQMYFLGKLVKKATRAVKKIVKSPIGKVALLAAGAGYGGFGPLKGLFSGVKGAGFLKSAGVKNFLFKDGVPGLSNLSGKGIASIIGGASIIPLLMGQKEEDEFDIDAYYAANRLNPNAPLNTRIGGSQFAFAEGGSTEKEPVATKTMPLLDMGGQEMDLRAEGGFVPIGRMEKADDVPARLSKNEFVFTADAVRNAGDGDVDKGAEVMYNMMKNLEDGGDVSEESQGLEGAKNMFQTSQRLGEVL